VFVLFVAALAMKRLSKLGLSLSTATPVVELHGCCSSAAADLCSLLMAAIGRFPFANEKPGPLGGETQVLRMMLVRQKSGSGGSGGSADSGLSHLAGLA
jgi:hypothetical protein